MNLFSDYDNKDEPVEEEPEYPDEVLESEWNPTLIEVHSRIISEKKSDKSKTPSEQD
jgi:hypothetical protein